MQSWLRALALGALLALLPTSAHSGDPAPQLAAIKNVGKEGAGNVAAAKAMKELIAQGPGALMPLLGSLADADPLASNYLRSAVESIADQAVKTGKPLPLDALEKFVQDRKQFGPARRLAYECLVRNDPKTPGRLLPTMLDDPASELRRDAVATLLLAKVEGLKKTDKEEARKVLGQALKQAREVDQLKRIAAELKELGQEIDLTRHLGFLTNWHIAAPFDNSDGKGYATAYPPEKGIDLQAKYKGKKEEAVAWKETSTKAAFGVVDLNKAVGKLKGAVAYAYTEVDSLEDRPVEVRIGSIVAVRAYLNGKEILSCEECHHAMEIDQYVGRGTLKKGRNTLLVKSCQNEQTEEWAQAWSFQLRVCDELGTPVPLTVVEPKLKGEKP